MEKKFNKHISKIAIFMFFLCLNYFQPISGDDVLRYNMNVFFNHTMINQLITDYQTLTGRISAQIPIYFFMNKGAPYLMHVFEFLNALIMTSFVIVLYKVVTDDKEEINSKKFVIFCGFFIVLFGLNNSISQMLSKTIGIQYFWGIALLTYFYYKCFTKKEFSPILSIMTGLIIGMYNEALSFICLSMFFSYIAHQIIVKEKVNLNCLFFLIPFFLGSVVMFTAPGSYAITHARYHMSLPQLLISHFWDYILMIFTEYELSPLFILALLCVALFEKCKTKRAMIIMCLVMIWVSIWPISFQFGRRISMLYMFSYFSVIAYYINKHPNHLKDICIRYYKISYVFILVMVALFMYVFGRYHYYETIRLDKVAHYSEIGIKDITLKPIGFNGLQLIKIEDITTDSNSYFNKNFANVYGFDKVYLDK